MRAYQIILSRDHESLKKSMNLHHSNLFSVAKLCARGEDVVIKWNQKCLPKVQLCISLHSTAAIQPFDFNSIVSATIDRPTHTANSAKLVSVKQTMFFQL